jgi:DNA-binding transcriptional MerR regulator
MLKISAQIGDDFLGTAEELALHVSAKLQALGFGDRHRATERLVRFYTYENLISKPERANDDRRKANYGSLQVRQLLLARLLAERGWELDRIRNLLKDNGHVDKLNKLIDELAQPNEAERLFFRTASHQDTEGHVRPASMRSNRLYSVATFDADAVSEPDAGMPSPRKSRFAHETFQQLRDLSESPMPAVQFRKLVIKESMRPDLEPEVRELYQQLLAFHPTSRGEEPKRERWTRLRLSHWCEASFHIDNRGRPSEEELDEIVNKFRKALKDSYLRV